MKGVKFSILKVLHIICIGTYRETMNVAELIGVAGLFHRSQKTQDTYYLSIDGGVYK